MNEQSLAYLQRLKSLYKDFNDNDSLLALAEVDEIEERARELAIYREQSKTMELIKKAIERHEHCVRRLIDPNKKMTELERELCFVSMDWCSFVLDIVGEDPWKINSSVDKIIEEYAKKAKII